MKRTKHYTRYGAVKSGARRPTQAGSVLSGALPNIALGPRLMEYRIKRGWANMVGAALARRTEPTRLIHGTLHCTVSSSSWMTELNYQKELIMEKINTALGEKAVSAILFKPGEIRPRKTAPPPAPPAKGRLGKEFIDKTASKIEDPALRSLVKRVMSKSPF
jgi:predicted nucleic acid-binding Zn ribbon protein